MKFFTSITILSIVGMLLVVPEVGSAQGPGLAQLAQCSGTDCTACNVVHLANGVIKWLIGFLFVVFAVLVAIAGVRLVISGGNSRALDDAKDTFINAIIGFIIILSAWLIVDTIMRGLIGNEGRLGTGDVSGWLFWSEVECQIVNTADPAQLRIISFGRVADQFWPGDPGNTFGTSQIVSLNSCAPTPGGNLDCSALETACRSAGNAPIIDTTNPTDYRVNCVSVSDAPAAPISGTGSSGCSGGTCVPLTIPCSAQGCTIAPDMVSRLAGMHAAAGVSGARVTEAMPPSRPHRSACHQNGTCVDYSKAGGMTGAEVARVVTAAQRNGLRPVYEVQTQSQKDALVASGAPAGNITVLGNWITAPHFSIYGN
jgi:hypothetical protein